MLNDFKDDLRECVWEQYDHFLSILFSTSNAAGIIIGMRGGMNDTSQHGGGREKTEKQVMNYQRCCRSHGQMSRMITQA